MISFFLHASAPDTLSSRSRTAAGVSYTITAQCATRKDGRAGFTAHWELVGVHTCHRFLQGTVSEDGQSMSGVWSAVESELAESTDEFYFTRPPPELLTVRPRPRVLEAGETRIRALWRFALDATLLRVRRRQPWRYIKDFIQRWNAYLDLLAPQASLSPERRAETSSSEDKVHDPRLSDIERSFTFEEACLCHIALELRNRASVEMQSVHPPPSPSPLINNEPLHSFNYFCDFCGTTHGPRDARYTCIPCSIACDTPIDVCDTPRCRRATFTAAAAAHRPAHDMLKIRGLVIWQRELPKLIRRARAAMARADEALKADAEEGGERGRMGCASCAAAVEYPFFACLDCAGMSTSTAYRSRIRTCAADPPSASRRLGRRLYLRHMRRADWRHFRRNAHVAAHSRPVPVARGAQRGGTGGGRGAPPRARGQGGVILGRDGPHGTPAGGHVVHAAEARTSMRVAHPGVPPG